MYHLPQIIQLLYHISRYYARVFSSFSYKNAVITGVQRAPQMC